MAGEQPSESKTELKVEFAAWMSTIETVLEPLFATYAAVLSPRLMNTCCGFWPTLTVAVTVFEAVSINETVSSDIV